MYLIEVVNYYYERLKTWASSRRRCVSSKSLPSYLAWMQEWFKDGIAPEHYIATGLGRRLINTYREQFRVLPVRCRACRDLTQRTSPGRGLMNRSAGSHTDGRFGRI